MKNTDDIDKRIKIRTFAIAVAATLFLICFNIALAASTTITYKKVEVTPEPKVVLIGTEPQPEEVIVSAESFLHYASFCESTHRQFNDDGSVLHGRVDPRDTGRWQINTYYWGDKAIELGYDIDTEHGNYMMAQHILSVQGEGAWSASAPCIAKNFGYVIK